MTCFRLGNLRWIMSVKLHIVGVGNEVDEEQWCILSVQTRLTKNPGMISFG